MTTIVPSHSTVAPLRSALDFPMSCCPATASSKSKSCNQPVITRFNASLSFRPMRLRRFTVCGLQNSPENRYCNVIIFVFTDMLLAVSGMYQLEKKEEGLHPSLRHPGRPPSEPDNINELNPPSKRRCLPTPLSSC